MRVLVSVGYKKTISYYYWERVLVMSMKNAKMGHFSMPQCSLMIMGNLKFSYDKYSVDKV